MALVDSMEIETVLDTIVALTDQIDPDVTVEDILGSILDDSTTNDVLTFLGGIAPTTEIGSLRERVDSFDRDTPLRTVLTTVLSDARTDELLDFLGGVSGEAPVGGLIDDVAVFDDETTVQEVLETVLGAQRVQDVLDALGAIQASTTLGDLENLVASLGDESPVEGVLKLFLDDGQAESIVGFFGGINDETTVGDLRARADGIDGSSAVGDVLRVLLGPEQTQEFLDLLGGVSASTSLDTILNDVQSEPQPSEEALAGNVFLEAGRAISIADPVKLFGRSGGNEGVFLDGTVTGVRLDANFEDLDIERAFEDVSFQVTGRGLEFLDEGSTVVSLPSLNQKLTIRFSDGSAELTQTGAQSFELTGGAGGQVTIRPDSGTVNGVELGGETAMPASDGDSSSAANVFLTLGSSFAVSGPVQVFGRSGGDEAIRLSSSATGVSVDANIERIDVPDDLADLSFLVGGSGLEISRDGTAIVSVPSLNQETELRFADGNGTLTQTGAQSFQLIGAEGGVAEITPDTSPEVDVALGNATASSVSLTGVNADGQETDLG